VIGDPGGLGFVLEAARREARAVYDVLKNQRIDTQLLLGAPEDGTGAGAEEGVPAADYFEVVDLLLSGEFDIVHYSGHAWSDSKVPNRAGWVFKNGVLTAHELEGMERPPKLVVANACLSSQLSQETTALSETRATGANSAARGDPALVASLADEFFKQGVSDYIGAAWEIPSEPAKLFAEEFYTALLARHSSPPAKIGAAVLWAREALYRERKKFGAAWAAYQHYGDPTRSISSRSVEHRTGREAGRAG
jgi:CHAT domain